MRLDRNYMLSRRAFVQAGASATACAVVPGFSYGMRDNIPMVVRRGSAIHTRSLATDPEADRIRALLVRAVDAAKNAGATYADARAVRVITQTVFQRSSSLVNAGTGTTVRFGNKFPMFEETERHAISVRALVNGAWGFTASPWWTEQEAVSLAGDAVSQARDNAQWTTNKIELAPAPVVTGSWTTPFRIDPFTIPVEEKIELLMRAEMAYRPLYRMLDRSESASFTDLGCKHVMRALATSEGTYTAQHFYTTALGQRFGAAQISGLDVSGPHPTWMTHWGDQNVSQDYPVPPGTGWETVADADFWTLGQEAADAAYAAMSERGDRPKGINLGQYTFVMDAEAVGKLVDLTIGRATDLDRITGLEANSGGTSYLGTDPLQLLGNYSFGTPLLTVTTTRASHAGKVTGLPTAQWDDEGVVHTPMTLVKDGVLQDLPTTRDRAPRLASYYAKRNRPVVSNGCAASGDGFGLELPTVNAPTLVMQPGTQNASLSDLAAGIPQGLALTKPGIRSDFQKRQLMISGQFREITNGRLGRIVVGGVAVIDAVQLWKNLTAIGGESSASLTQGTWMKGVPPQTLPTAVVAVPAVFRDIPVVNGGRL